MTGHSNLSRQEFNFIFILTEFTNDIILRHFYLKVLIINPFFMKSQKAVFVSFKYKSLLCLLKLGMEIIIL